MTEMRPILSLASAAALALVLGQAVAETAAPTAEPTAAAAPVTEPTAPAAPVTEPTPPAPEAAAPAPVPPGPPQAIIEMREQMNQRAAEIAAERKRRYEDLRGRAAEVGLKLPETPPWEQAAFQPPEMPPMPEMPEMPAMPTPPEMPQGMPAPTEGMTVEQLKAYMNAMRAIEQEERDRRREERWNEMRKRAAEQGVELPETPPWKQAEQRMAAMRAKWQEYRKLVEELTPEQKEAAEAVFGAPARRMAQPQPQPPMPQRPMPPMGAPGGNMPYAPGPGWGMQKPMMPPPGYGYGGEPRMPVPPAGYRQSW